MAIHEVLPEPNMGEYRDPSRSMFVAELIGHEILKGFRTCIIDLNTVVFEPLQKGVHRYPPVVVHVPRDPVFNERYLKMEPTLQSDFFKKSEHALLPEVD